jgi:hypothetical protein
MFAVEITKTLTSGLGGKAGVFPAAVGTAAVDPDDAFPHFTRNQFDFCRTCSIFPLTKKNWGHDTGVGDGLTSIAPFPSTRP